MDIRSASKPAAAGTPGEQDSGSARRAAVRSPRLERGPAVKRVLLAAVACTAALLACASVVSGASGSRRAAPAKANVAIKEKASTKQNSDNTHSGQFSLELNAVIQDSGTSSISPTVGAVQTVGGQAQYPVTGYNDLKTKKGTLNFSFVGISILVNGKFYNEYGSWKVRSGTGMYKGWKGGGRWADVGTPSADNIEWDGVITHP
ncbi:MAG: hypothetical protein QOK36_4144 [Gaiellales bacterium]|jgi:hypothetical protein|nr:hypothetical protein [Gaiellales bacterium]